MNRNAPSEYWKKAPPMLQIFGAAVFAAWATSSVADTACRVQLLPESAQQAVCDFANTPPALTGLGDVGLRIE